MFKVGDIIVYKKDVCKIIEIKSKYIRDLDYYVLEPIDDMSLKIQIPKNNNFIRELISKEEIHKIIKDIPKIPVITTDDKMIENEYKRLLQEGTHKDLISIIKTTYLRNEERKNNNKKVGEKDNNYFKLAEKYLYNEFSIVLNKTVEDTKKYIINEVEKL